MLTNQQLNFQNHLKELIPFITLQATENYYKKQKKQTDTSSPQTQSHQLIIKSQKIRDFKIESTLMASHQIEDCLIFAFCLVHKQTSNITLQLFRKSNQAIIEKHLKQLKVTVSTMTFKFNKLDELQLILGTKCGRIFIYRNFQYLELSVSAFRISACPIHQILSTTLQNTIFVLQESGIIYVVDILLGLVKLQLHCLIPGIKDSSMKLLIDSSYNYGRIIVWNMKDHIKPQINLVDQMNTPQIHQEQKIFYKKLVKKQGKQVVKKKVLLKPNCNFLSCVLQGIFWIDFLGEFFIILTKNGKLKIIALNIQEQAQNLELYRIINQIKVLQDDQVNEKQNFLQKIADVRKLNQKFIMICKQKQTVFCDKKYEISIQKYEIGEKFRLSKIRTIRFDLNCLIQQIRVNYSQQYIFCRTKKTLSIVNFTDLQKLQKNMTK